MTTVRQAAGSIAPVPSDRGLTVVEDTVGTEGYLPWAERLVRLMETNDWWRKQLAVRERRDYALYSAMREIERDVIWARCPAESRSGVEGLSSYVVDPLPLRIASAWGELIFGTDPVFTVGEGGPQERLEFILEGNNVPNGLQRAEAINVSEGEVWWRVCSDHETADYPILEWHSRLGVFPLWSGRRAMAVAFIEEVEEVSNTEVYRLVEIQVDRVCYSRLYKGSKDKLGVAIPLESHPTTGSISAIWAHGLPMLCGRVPNLIGKDYHWGIGDFHLIRDFAWGLNEAASIGIRNMRLAAKKRLLVPTNLLDDEGKLDFLGADVIRLEALDKADGQREQISQVEYEFDALPLIAYDDHLVAKILRSVGLAPQLVGLDINGQAESGTALRTRVLNSILVRDAKARAWDDNLPKGPLVSLQRVDALPVGLGGFGQRWASPEKPPTVERGTALPEDPAELVDRVSAAVLAKIMSQETAVAKINPDWGDDEVKKEIDRIKKDVKESMPVVPRLGSINDPSRQQPPRPSAPAGGPGQQAPASQGGAAK